MYKVSGVSFTKMWSHLTDNLAGAHGAFFVKDTPDTLYVLRSWGVVLACQEARQKTLDENTPVTSICRLEIRKQ